MSDSVGAEAPVPAQAQPPVVPATEASATESTTGAANPAASAATAAPDTAPAAPAPVAAAAKPDKQAAGEAAAAPVAPPPANPSGLPTVLIPEPVSADGLRLLPESEFLIDYRPQGLTPAELLSLIPNNYDALIVRSATKVTAAVLEAAGPRLRVVARAGVGVDNIDVSAATARGVVVVNSPSGNIAAAAEHTLALLFATARHVARADASVKEGRWERSKLVGVEVGGRTLGIVGLGKVGLKVARAAGAGGLGMTVLAVDPYASADIARAAGVELCASLDEMLPRVDFLTVHTPLLASTLDLISERELRLMKPGARVLNVARGGVYNEAALLRALDEGWIAGAGIDVWTQEPLPKVGTPEFDGKNGVAIPTVSKLARHPKVVATPHLGASTVEAQENVALDVCAQVREVLRGGLPSSAVNAPLILPEEYRKLQPFVRLVERMGSLYTQHFAMRSGSGTVTYTGHGTNKVYLGDRRFELVYQGELAGMANTRPLLAALVKGLVGPISDGQGANINIVNAALVAKERGIVVTETHERGPLQAYASLVTLRSRRQHDDKKKDGAHDAQEDSHHIIEGYVSGNAAYIARLGRFSASFIPHGTLIILHNYDQPGEIGGVGTVLGRHGINIRFMQVASLNDAEADNGNADGAPAAVQNGNGSQQAANEALMILGVAGDVTSDVVGELGRSEGILDVNVVRM